QSKSMRIAAKCWLTVGADRFVPSSSIYAAIATGVSEVNSSCRVSHQLQNCPTACAYAVRVFRLRIVAVKNSTNRRTASSPARTIRLGNGPTPRIDIACLLERGRCCEAPSSPPVSCIITSFMIPDHPSPAQAQIRLPAVDNSPLFVTRSQTEWLEISPKTCGTTFPCVTPCSGERDRDGDFHPTAVPPPPMDSATSFAGHI